MCKGFNCLDCPAINSQNCYYYGKDLVNYYKKIQLEKLKYSNKYYSTLEIVEFNI
ncbi:MAG: hypothetical protein ACFFA0_08795 [Promethearchaeota archaeon]